MGSNLLPQFLPQCCDAFFYLLQGESCAVSNECYDQLRPIGAQLWFSLPYRLGLPAESLIFVHWGMLLLSIVLSVIAIRRWTTIDSQPLRPINHSTWILFLFSAAAHIIFFWPVMQVALTDAPASLFALIAIWLLIIENNRPRAFMLALAGLLLGLSAWIRFAYFYPLLGMLTVYVLLWLFNKQRRNLELLLLTALIPIAIQCAATFLHHGTLGFLGPRASTGLSSEHSLSFAAGQETILPQQQYLWPTNCERKIGIEQALHEKDFFTVFCLMANRLYFSFGSYAPDTYIFAATNLLTHSTIEQVGLDNRWRHWRNNGIRRISGKALTPNGSHRSISHHLIADAEPGLQDRTVSAEKRIPLGVPYTFSVWLWAPTTDSIDLILSLPTENGEVARKTVQMTSQPTRFFVTGTPPAHTSFFAPDFGDLTVTIGSTLSHPVSFGDRPMAEFYAWGAQLEQSPIMTDYQGPDANVTHTNFRKWLPGFFVMNLIAAMSVVVLIFLLRKQTGPQHYTAIMFMALIIAEIIVTQPEQRFVIAVEVFIWVCFAASLLVGVQRTFTQLDRR